MGATENRAQLEHELEELRLLLRSGIMKCWKPMMSRSTVILHSKDDYTGVVFV
jgi:hypothetical protein